MLFRITRKKWCLHIVIRDLVNVIWSKYEKNLDSIACLIWKALLWSGKIFIHKGSAQNSIIKYLKLILLFLYESESFDDFSLTVINRVWLIFGDYDAREDSSPRPLE